MQFPSARKTLVGAAMLALMTVSQAAQSAAPVYAGDLGTGGTFTGMVSPDSGPFGTPALWDFWTLTVPFASDPVPFSAPITVTVRRLDAAMDPILGVWLGEESDVGNYFDMTSDALSSTWYAFGDDELPANVGTGPGGDAMASFTATLPGTYVIAVGDHTLTPTASGALSYQITAAIPEPETYALMLAGLGLVGAMAARRRTGRAG